VDETSAAFDPGFGGIAFAALARDLARGGVEGLELKRFELKGFERDGLELSGAEGGGRG